MLQKVWFDASFFMLCNIPFYHFMPQSKWSSVWKRYYRWAFLIYLTSSVWTLYSFPCCFSQRSLRWTGDGLQYIESQAEGVRRFDSYIDLGFAISSVKPKGLWVGLAIWGLFLSLTNTYTHTHLYLITVTLHLACFAFELSISGDITPLTSLPPFKERLIRSTCSWPMWSSHLFLHPRIGLTCLSLQLALCDDPQMICIEFRWEYICCIFFLHFLGYLNFYIKGYRVFKHY